MLRGPDFFIVGAPKCGTTALAHYLAQHPEVGMAERKESHYLVGDLAPRLVDAPRRRLGLEEYLGLFAAVQDKRRLGESSVWYLYSHSAAREIEHFSPHAQIIIMLRNPIEMLASLHSEFVQREIEPEGDFETALSLDQERLQNVTPRGFPPHSYRHVVRYAEQIERYVEVFGRERIHVIIYDDFRDDTMSAFQATCQFLGVGTGFIPDMNVVNPNRRTRNRALQRLIRRPPQPLRALMHTVTSRTVRNRTGVMLTRLNRKVVPRDPVPTRVAESLLPGVEHEVVALDELLGLDLSRWLTRPVVAEKVAGVADQGN